MYRILNTHSDFLSIVKIGNSGLIIRRTIAMSSSQIFPLFFFAEEEIYADLGLVRRGTNHDHNRSVHSAAARLSDWRFEPKEKRDFVLVELLETEANYGQAHDMFSRIFRIIKSTNFFHQT